MPLLLAIVGGFVVCVFALTVVEVVLAVVVVSVALGYVVHSMFPAVDTYLLSSLPVRHRGSAYALYSASAMIVQALGSGTVGTVVAGGASYTATFRALAVGVGTVVVALFVLYRGGWLPAGGGHRRGPPRSEG